MKKAKAKNNPKPRTKLPVFVYYSVCHREPAEKPPCIAPKRGGDPASLGHWRCTGCRKPCKVTRQKRVEKPVDNPLPPV